MEVDERRHVPGRKPADSGEDKKAYEKLRDEGNSKSKSARFRQRCGGLVSQDRGPQRRQGHDDMIKDQLMKRGPGDRYQGPVVHMGGLLVLAPLGPRSESAADESGVRGGALDDC